MDELEGAFTDDRRISTDQLVKVCKYRQEKLCCRYIYFPAQEREFFCAKKISALREKIDGAVSDMTAQGDNCLGLP